MRSDSWGVEAVLLGTLVALVYVIGHTVASASALLLDRVYLAKGHGYPFPRLLASRPGEKSTGFSPDFYRALFFWINAYLFCRYFGLWGGVPLNVILPDPIRQLVPDVLTAQNLRWAARTIGLGMLVMVVAKLVVSSREAQHSTTFKALFEHPNGVKFVDVAQRSMAALAVPARGITSFVGSFLSARQPLDEATRLAFRERLPAVLSSRLSTTEVESLFSTSSPYWYSAIALRRVAPELEALAENWLRLYSFARNLGTALYLSFMYCLLWLHNEGPTLLFSTEDARYTTYAVPLILWAASFLLLIRFYYLYFDYYSKYLIRAFVFISREDAKTG